MPRLANDGRGRLGGRTKGTPNKPLLPVTEWVTIQLNRNRSFIEQQLRTPQTETGTQLLSALIIAAALHKEKAKIEQGEPELIPVDGTERIY